MWKEINRWVSVISTWVHRCDIDRQHTEKGQCGRPMHSHSKHLPRLRRVQCQSPSVCEFSSLRVCPYLFFWNCM